MANEAGDKKLLGNFRTLIDQLSADPNYNPANPKLIKKALDTQYTTGQAAVDDVSTKGAPNKLAITVRQSGFDDLRPLVIRSRNVLKASGASKGDRCRRGNLVRKLTGGRKSAKVKDDPKTPEDESKASNSASQMSFDNQLGNLGSYLAILANVPAYNPNERFKAHRSTSRGERPEGKERCCQHDVRRAEPGARPARSVALSGRRLRREHRAARQGLRQWRVGQGQPTL